MFPLLGVPTKGGKKDSGKGSKGQEVVSRKKIMRREGSEQEKGNLLDG